MIGLLSSFSEPALRLKKDRPLGLPLRWTFTDPEPSLVNSFQRATPLPSTAFSVVLQYPLFDVAWPTGLTNRCGAHGNPGGRIGAR